MPLKQTTTGGGASVSSMTLVQAECVADAPLSDAPKVLPQAVPLVHDRRQLSPRHRQLPVGVWSISKAQSHRAGGDGAPLPRAQRAHHRRTRGAIIALNSGVCCLPALSSAAASRSTASTACMPLQDAGQHGHATRMRHLSAAMMRSDSRLDLSKIVPTSPCGRSTGPHDGALVPTCSSWTLDSSVDRHA